MRLGFAVLSVLANVTWHFDAQPDNWTNCLFLMSLTQRYNSATSCHGLGAHFTTTTPQPFYGPFSGTTRVSRCQKRNFWTLWCKGKLTEADTLTIRLVATPSGLTSAHLHHPLIFYSPDALPVAQPTVSKHWMSTFYCCKTPDGYFLAS